MKPRIFVSSTFYDLKYIREDLANFIKAHDFEPIMFEDGDIGYTPGKALDKSCYDTMKTADMVLLIIGGEYGSPATGEKEDKFNEYISITRNEFRAAAETGMPIYVFVESSVYAEYGVYEVNIDNIENKGISIEFKSTKNINVFRFIKEVRSFTDKPIQEFKRSTEIKNFLSKQWSDMFKNYLVMLRTKEENAYLQNSVSDLEALIKQMGIMIDAVGKKVIGDTDTEQYEVIIQKQNKVEARRICETIASGINVIPMKSNSRYENVSNLLAMLQKTCIEFNGKLPNSELEFTDDINGDLAGRLFINAHKHNLNLMEVSGVLIRSLSDIVKSLDNAEIKELVVNQLQLKYNYLRIFSNLTEEEREEPTEE